MSKAFEFYCLVRQMRREQKALNQFTGAGKMMLVPESQEKVDAWIERTEEYLKNHPGYEG